MTHSVPLRGPSWSAAVFPGARVYSFEPSARSSALLEKNVAGLPNVQCFPCGLYRRGIEQLLADDFLLGAASSRGLHRGTNLYVSRRVLEEHPELGRDEIRGTFPG